ncbi:hypothetical protein ABMA60_09935, partial [Saccharospirillum sp. HFRX-2]
MDALTSFSIKHILLSFIVLLTLAGCEPPDELGNAGERNAGQGIPLPNFEIDNPFGNGGSGDGGSGDGSDGVCTFPFNLDDPDCAKLCDTQNPPPAECGNGNGGGDGTCDPSDVDYPACLELFCSDDQNADDPACLELFCSDDQNANDPVCQELFCSDDQNANDPVCQELFCSDSDNADEPE